MGKPKPSLSTAHKARFRANRLRNMREQQYCRPVFIGPAKIIFSYAGHEIVFEDKDGYLTRVNEAGYQYHYTNEEDFAWMFAEAEVLMKAARAAIKAAQNNNTAKKCLTKTRRSSSSQQLTLFAHIP